MTDMVSAKEVASLTKTCPRCKVVRLRSEFYRDSWQRDGLTTSCKICQGEIAKRSAAKDPKKRARIIRNSRLKSRFGITMDEYSILSDRQDHKCAICHGEPIGRGSKTKTFSVDHNHETGEVRGLLCSKCNSGLGFFCDNPKILREALSYLEKSCG